MEEIQVPLSKPGLTKQLKNYLLFLITFRFPTCFQIDKKVMDAWAENVKCTNDSLGKSYTNYNVSGCNSNLTNLYNVNATGCQWLEDYTVIY